MGFYKLERCIADAEKNVWRVFGNTTATIYKSDLTGKYEWVPGKYDIYQGYKPEAYAWARELHNK